MAISIQTNASSLIAQENLRVNNDFQAKTIGRLTSGFRINQSGDDAAGLAIANKFRSDTAELTQGVRNANDGLSQLQIIDGGLSNISKILDRMKTLATQSASSTFTGNRTTLNTEYSTLISEINRQAANIGLGTGDSQAGRFNADIKVFIGGGSAQSNSQVAVNLSGSTNLVNATALGLTGTSIAGSITPVSLSTEHDYRTGALYLATGGSQKYSFSTTKGNVDVTVQGDSDGLTGEHIVTQLNQGLAGTGINVGISTSDGSLQVSSTSSFAVTVAGAVTTGTAVQNSVVVGAAKVNTGKYHFEGGAVTDNTTAGETLTFTPTGKTAITVAIGITDSKDTIFNKLHQQLDGTGIDVLRSGDNVFFQSDTDFTVSRGVDTGTGGLAGVANNTSHDADNRLGSSDPTSSSLTALTSLQNAIDTLGSVQGKVGTGQNQLAYAINLAQSQISNFSAAESRIRDTDVAAEAANLTKASVLSQASMAAMAQANSAPQSVLALLRG